MAISGIHTHSGPGGYLQFVLYDITSLGFVKQSYDALLYGILEVTHTGSCQTTSSKFVHFLRTDSTTLPRHPSPPLTHPNPHTPHPFSHRLSSCYLTRCAEERTQILWRSVSTVSEGSFGMHLKLVERGHDSIVCS